MRNDFYFTIYATESEHSFIEYDIKEYCSKFGIEFLYYRIFKNGHEPMYRECKVKCNKGMFKKMIDDLNLKNSIGNVNKKIYFQDKKMPKFEKEYLAKWLE